MSERLKPCPFCGSDRVSFLPDDEQLLEDTITGFIWCRGCGFSSDSFYSEKDALENWNRRTPDTVRCGECRFYEKSTMKCFKPVDDEHSFHDYAAPIWKPDDFCSYGELQEMEEPNGM